MSRIQTNFPTNFDPGDGERTVAITGSRGGIPLPIGYRLQEFVIEGLIGEGGFSIVYLARDTRLQRHVALKEYIPSSLAERRGDQHVTARSPKHRPTFELGLRSFVNEAQLLASFDHPSLIRVYRFWEENGTAYMVMPYVRAPTLKQWIGTHGQAIEEPWLRALFESLIDALELLHADRCYHRDIAPDNILLLGEQAGTPRPLLLDFGAARRVIGDATQALTVILKPGYAPIEQYSESSAGSRQGPWTDIYALSAVMYAVVTGAAPTASVSRLLDDDVIPAWQIASGRYSPQLLAAIDAGMAVRPEHRPQSMAALRELLTGRASPPPSTGERLAAETVASATALAPGFIPAPAPAPGGSGRFRVDPSWADAPTAGESRPAADQSDGANARSSSTTTATVVTAPPQKPRSALPWAIAGALLVLALAAAWRYIDRSPAKQPEIAVSRQPVPQTAVPDGSAPAIAPKLPSTGIELAAPPTGTASSAAAAASAPLLSLAQPAPAPAAVLQDIARQADPRLLVVATTDRPQLTIGRDRLRVRVQSVQPGYLYLYFADTAGQVYLLFPSGIADNNRIEAGQSMSLPAEDWKFIAEGPPGTSHVLAMVSRYPRDFAGSALRPSRLDFDMRLAELRWRQRQNNPLIGRAICDAPRPCVDEWGAAVLPIEEVAAVPGRR